MAPKVSPIPADRPQLSAYICVDDGARAIAFYEKAFGATELMRMAEPGGRVGHAEVRIGSATLMLSSEYRDMGAVSPKSLGGSPVMLHLYVEDADAVVERAVAAGARLDSPVENQFYGDRGGKLTDPFGHRWWIASRVEDVPIDEQKRRAKELYGMT